MVMIKDNHMTAQAASRSRRRAVRDTTRRLPYPIEVEARTLDELREVPPYLMWIVLLDNMSNDQMREAVVITNGRVKLEAPGQQ